jgi:hypothetical protein
MINENEKLSPFEILGIALRFPAFMLFMIIYIGVRFPLRILMTFWFLFILVISTLARPLISLYANYISDKTYFENYSEELKEGWKTILQIPFSGWNFNGLIEWLRYGE